MLVRSPTPNDRDGLLGLLSLRHEEMGLGTFDPERAGRTLQLAIDGTATVIAGVIGDEGAPEATIGLTLAQWWDSADMHVEALWDYVHPDHRNRKAKLQHEDHSRKLRRYAEIVADRFGVPLVMGGPIRAGHEGIVHGYCKNFRPIGAFFMYDGPEAPRATKQQRERWSTSLFQVFAERAK